MKTYLLETAGALQQPQASAVLAFSRKKDQLVAQGNQSMAERADLEKLIGKNNQQMAEDNNRNFARFMESVCIRSRASIPPDLPPDLKHALGIGPVPPGKTGGSGEKRNGLKKT